MGKIQLTWPVNPQEMREDYPYGIIKEGELYHQVNREYSDLNESERRKRDPRLSFALSEHQMKQLEKLCGKSTSGGYFLYDDRTPPWTSKRNLNSYLNKLEKWRSIID